LVDKKKLFKPVGILLIVAGLVTIIASIEVFLLKSNQAFGTLPGVLLILLLSIVGGFEMNTARAIYRTEMGSWRGSLNLMILGLLSRAFLIYANYKVYLDPKGKEDFVFALLILNLVFLVVEGLTLLLLYRFKDAFMPTEQERQVAMRKLSGPLVKTVSECPNCHEIIEKEWVLCPQCGTHLPRHCANCGHELKTKGEKCPSCGASVEHSETAQKSIQSLKIIADQDSRPEARSVRFARLADAYLKAGEIDLALETYRKAIHYTEFRRKQSNFMVKMAMVLHNDGRNDEALQVLEGALELDPQDAAGALEIKNQILAQKS